MRRGTTFALLLFSLVFLNISVFGYEGVVVATRSTSTSISETVFLLLIVPTFISSLVAGLLAALGAFIGSRVSQPGDASEQYSGWGPQSVGAGIGAAVGTGPLLLYIGALNQSSFGMQIALFGMLIVFVGFIVFAALWCRRVDRVRSVAPSSSDREVAG
ncbi:hypothetical protein AB0O87_01760 [Microbacterium sp. NPDC076768]|uniref:hypothetical protein n=1 Tax=Microbacterium sp. NPDC076768 TaxID=3154858 RepID=UPI0034169A27